MAENQFLPFATAGGANVVSQAEYDAMGDRATGFQAGIAESDEFNKVFRQGTFFAAVLGQFIVDILGEDVLDDGDVADKVTLLTDAIGALIADSQVGSQIGYAYSQSSQDYTGVTTTLPTGSVPQNTDGTELTQIATSITPKAATSLLEITVAIPNMEIGSNNSFIGAIFRDSGADAIAAAAHYVNSMDPAGTRGSGGFFMRAIVAAGSLSATTFKFRFGGNTANAVSINNYFGAAGVASMTVREIAQ